MLNQVVLGKYLILGELYEATLGSVYFGRDDSGGGAPVLVKSISPLHLKSVDATELFETEFKRLQGITAPGISAVLDLGTDRGSYMVVTEYVEGFDLAHWFAAVKKKRGEMPVSVALDLAKKVLDALTRLHEPEDGNPSIIHRDLKPSNIIVDRDGGATLTDFGLSRIVAKGTAVFDPGAGDKLGYLSPELVMNVEPGPASDVYGVGLLLYELLVGENPFAIGNLAATLSAVMKETPPTVSSKRGGAPAGLDAIIAKALEKKPEDRYATAAEMSAALAACVPADAGAETAALIAEDFDDAIMTEVKSVIGLAERQRLIEEARPSTESAEPWVPPARLPTEQREREQTTTSGVVVAKRAKRDSQAAVWREISPSSKAAKGPSAALLIVGAIIVVLVGVLLGLLLR